MVQPWEMFFKQLTDFKVLVLLAAAMISGVLGDYIDVLAIMAIVFLNYVLGFIQEYKAEKSIEVLRSLSTPKSWLSGMDREYLF